MGRIKALLFSRSMQQSDDSRNVFQEHLRRVREKKKRQLTTGRRTEKPPLRLHTPARLPLEPEPAGNEYDEYADSNRSVQTYPHHRVVRQGLDLTCGMRCLQNLYTEDIVTRKEMDHKSKELEAITGGLTMYDPKLGYYSIEVLQAILTDKGKHIQRVDLDKFHPQYFEPAIAMNPQFVGYVVAIGNGAMKHYVAIQHSQGMYTIIDSLPGKTPVSIPATSLFQRRADQRVYCSQNLSDTQPVVAVVAVAASPFVEYSIMHDSWSLPPPPARFLLATIGRILRTTMKSTIRKIERAEPCVQEWFQEFQKQRIAPPENCIPFWTQLIHGNPLVSIIVQLRETQTIIDCHSIRGLLQELLHMGWISDKCQFDLQQEGRMLRSDSGADIELESEGSFAEYSLDTQLPVRLLLHGHLPIQASVGGFYTFHSAVTGLCVDNKYNAYSVQDRHGTVHVLYKQTVEKIRVMT